MMLRLSIVMQMDTCGLINQSFKCSRTVELGCWFPFQIPFTWSPHKFPYCCEKVSLVSPHCLKAAMTKQVCFMLQSSLFDQAKAGSCRDQRPHPCLESSSLPTLLPAFLLSPGPSAGIESTFTQITVARAALMSLT